MNIRLFVLSFILPSFVMWAACGSEEGAVCGDGLVEHGEECDDSNTDDGDGCSRFCRVERGWDCSSGECEPICGDGRVVGPELCDPAGPSGEYCSDDCMSFDGECGDGIVQTPWEECDDGNTTSFDGCSSTCQWSYGFTCDDEEPSVCVATGLDGELLLGDLDYDQLTEICAWMTDLVGGPGTRFTCGAWEYTVSTVAACANGLNSNGFGPDATCTVGSFESYMSELGNRCAVMEADSFCN